MHEKKTEMELGNEHCRKNVSMNTRQASLGRQMFLFCIFNLTEKHVEVRHVAVTAGEAEGLLKKCCLLHSH